ncbi:FAGR238Cp [Eremothecium gossypii FDAG1]|nr:FAGR238Cp [Eremothecium gossypii FDAG1]
MITSMVSSDGGAPSLLQPELDRMCDLRHRVLGDQASKLQLFLEDGELIQHLIDIDSRDVEKKVKSLELLLSLMNLEADVRNELDYVYASMATRIMRTISLDETVPVEVCHKTLQLLNLCLNNCGIDYCNGDADVRRAVPVGLPGLLIHFLGMNEKQMTPEQSISWANTLLELMSAVLKCREVVSLPQGLLLPLEALMLSLVDRYGHQLDLKYILKVSVAPNPKDQEYMAFSNRGIGSNQLLPFTSTPRALVIQNPLHETLLWLAIVLYIECYKVHPVKNNLWLDSSFTVFVTGLLKSQNTNLKACAVHFLVTPYFFNPKKMVQKQSLQLWLPYLIDLINYDDVPWWFDPLDTLVQLVTYYNTQNPLNNEIIEYLYRTNLLHGLITVFVKCLSLEYQTTSSLGIITSYLKLFAQVTANDEKCRLLLLEDNQLMQHVEHALQTHLDLLSVFILSSDKMKEMIGPNDVMPPFYTSEVTLQWVTLLKSFSRSVNSLRTRLRRTLLGEQLLQMAETIYMLLKKGSFASDDLLKAEMDILATVFAVISNFAMEFSNLQVYMVKHGVLQMAHDILLDPLFNSHVECGEEYMRYKKRFPTENISAVKINVLWMLKHLIYNSNTEDKLELLKVIPMDIILEYINDQNWAVQEQCFQLLRNLTCNSRKVINILLYHFREKEPFNSPQSNDEHKCDLKSTYLFEFLTKKLRSSDPKNAHQMGTIVSIIHIIVNFTVINESKRQMVIEQEEVLEIVKAILSESSANNSRFCNNEDAKLGCIWMLTNLIWNSSFTSYTHSAPVDYTPTAPTGDASTRNSEAIRSALFEPGNSGNYSDDSENDAETEGVDMDEAGDFVRLSFQSPTSANPALVRYRRLEKMGFYELIHERTFDEYLNVRERARTLLFHMDMLRKGGAT